jgi:prepilin signal peptidase PulO-like enzyme (type II secretory pathway)
LIADRVSGKKKTGTGTQVPFGPFLALGCFITLFYAPEILIFIERYFYI